MTEWISVRRQSRGVLITVTQRIGNNTVSAKEEAGRDVHGWD